MDGMLSQDEINALLAGMDTAGGDAAAGDSADAPAPDAGGAAPSAGCSPRKHSSADSCLRVVICFALEVGRRVAWCWWDRRRYLAHYAVEADVLSIKSASLGVNPHCDVLSCIESGSVFIAGFVICI